MPAKLVCTVLRRSSKSIHELSAQAAMGTRRTPPDPGCGMAVELGSGDAGDVGDVVGVGHRRAGEGFAPEQAPPPFDQVQPGGADRNEGVLDPRVGGQPVPDGTAGVAGQVIGNQVQVAVGRGVVKRLQQREGARGVARGSRLSSAPAQCARTGRRRPRSSRVRARS